MTGQVWGDIRAIRMEVMNMMRVSSAMRKMTVFKAVTTEIIPGDDIEAEIMTAMVGELQRTTSV